MPHAVVEAAPGTSIVVNVNARPADDSITAVTGSTRCATKGAAAGSSGLASHAARSNSGNSGTVSRTRGMLTSGIGALRLPMATRIAGCYRLLIVDDHPIITPAVVRLLRSFSHATAVNPPREDG